MVKLTNKKIRWLVKNVTAGKVSTKDIASTYGVTQRRVQQLVKEYKDTGKIPELNPKRRPKTELTDEQKKAIDKAWEDQRLSAKLLYWELKRKGQPVPKNKIYQYLKATGRSRPNLKKQKKRKRCRYERKHSLSLVHTDWYDHNGTQVIAVEDDASRYLLSLGEFSNATTENVIKVFEDAGSHARSFNGHILAVNSDRGTQFYANKRDSRGFARHKFGLYLDSKDIKHIPSRRNNPQTNGKMERWFQEYRKHRSRFESAQEFMDWYNNRLHGALRLEWGERPGEAFVRKLRPGCILGIFLEGVNRDD